MLLRPTWLRPRYVVLGRRPDEELQTGLEFVISFQAFGESRTISTSGILGQYNMMLETQSGYRWYHSTETAAMKVYNDLLLAADDGDVTGLCLLDFTGAFDTVDHDLLMIRL